MYEFIYNVISVVQTVVLFRGKLSEGRKYVILFWGFSRSSRILNFSDEKWLKNYDKKRIFFLQFDFEKLKWKLESKNSNIFIQTAKDPPSSRVLTENILINNSWNYLCSKFIPQRFRKRYKWFLKVSKVWRFNVNWGFWDICCI